PSSASPRVLDPWRLRGRDGGGGGGRRGRLLLLDTQLLEPFLLVLQLLPEQRHRLLLHLVQLRLLRLDGVELVHQNLDSVRAMLDGNVGRNGQGLAASLEHGPWRWR